MDFLGERRSRELYNNKNGLYNKGAIERSSDSERVRIFSVNTEQAKESESIESEMKHGPIQCKLNPTEPESGRMRRGMNIDLRLGVIALILGGLVINQATPIEGAKCEPIKVPVCLDMPWNLTHMPNLVHHSAQENAGLVLSQFGTLLKTPCSRYLKFFLCSMFTPMCFVRENFQKSVDDKFQNVIPPCRRICNHARENCEPILRKHNISWPEQLTCEYLPEYHRGMCVVPEAFVDPLVETSCSVANPVNCRKKKCKKTKVKRKKQFQLKKYDFVIQATVINIVQNPCDAKVNVNVSQIWRKSSVEFGPGQQTLVFNGTCACPKIKKRRTYVLAGHEETTNGDLFLHSGSLAEKWSTKWRRRLEKWIKKFPSRNKKRKKREPTAAMKKKGRKMKEG